jgi:regulatory protein
MTNRPARNAAPKPVTPQSLEASALYYLERFASSAAGLRRVLMRRVQRSAACHGTDPAEGAAAVEALIARFQANRLLDDRAYAEAKAGSLHRRGASARLIAATLAAKGVDPDLIGGALAERDDETGHAPRPGGDLAAAAAFIRRRRLGPYRRAAGDDAGRNKDLGALARAGFSRGVATRLLACADPEAVEALLQENLHD